MNSTARPERRARVAAAAGDAVASLLRPTLLRPSLPRSTSRPGEVVAVTRHAVFVTVSGDPSRSRDAPRTPMPGLLCVADAEAVRLPCSIVVAGALPPVELAAPVAVGDGGLRLPGYDVQVGRWWRVPRPVLVDPVTATRRSTQLPVDDLLHGTALPRRPVEAFRRALAVWCASGPAARTRESSPPTPAPPVPPVPHEHALFEAVAGLLGLGQGLTPAGDDVLAGALVALTAARHPLAGQLQAAVVGADVVRRTTIVSAALLAHAARGACVPAFADLLTTLDASQGPAGLGQGTAMDPGVAAAVRAVLRVGHTSGAALLVGLVYGLAATVHAPSTPPSLRTPPSTHLPSVAQSTTDPARKALT